MTTYRLLVEYDGSAFSGWQIQPDRPTVQGALTDALALLTRGSRIVPVGAGRTDAGVHAEGQVASFRTDAPLEVPRLARALTALTPDALVVRAAFTAQTHFHARRLARARTYRYRLLEAPSALWRDRAWWPRAALDPERVRAAAAHLAGTHDMTSFAATGDTSASKTCRVSQIAYRPWSRGHELEITGDRFLHHMVRNVVGTLVDVGAGRRPPESVPAIIAARDRRHAGPTAPARGLTFMRVDYDAKDLAEATH